MSGSCIDHGLSGNKPGGYHQVRIDGRLYYVHRLAYAQAHSIPIEEVPPLLRHTCDNPRCKNPDHLLPGTHKDNAQDRVSRGRSAKVKLSTRVLTPEEDAYVFSMVNGKRAYSRESSQRNLASFFGVSKTAVVGSISRTGAKYDRT
jgi:HNH endonuclease